jgi:type II secretory pathway pseudopilin PulG
LTSRAVQTGSAKRVSAMHSGETMGRRVCNRSKGTGLSLISTLVALAVIGFAAAAAIQSEAIDTRRSKERSLLFIGEEFEQAILSYYNASTGNPLDLRYPTDLSQLLEDKRYGAVRRHLRKIYNDPITGKSQWGLVKSGDQIIGIHSLSDERPLSDTAFGATGDAREATSYRAWVFGYPSLRRALNSN